MATRYRQDEQKLQIEGQTIQWLQNNLLLLFISSVSCGHCIVWPSICCFCLSRLYLVAIVLSDLRFVHQRSNNTMTTRYRQDEQKLQIEGQTIQWLQNTDEIKRSYKSSIVWPLMWSFCWSRQYLVAIVLSDLRFVASVDLVSILWPL
jgi:hypothetical protein